MKSTARNQLQISLGEEFQVIGPPNAVFALVGEDVTLPASMSPALNAQGFDVRWTRNDFFKPVLLYQNSEIITKNQIEAYKGRTSLFTEELVNGNVSLRLQDVRVSDDGLYKCFVYSGQWEEDAHFTLNVEGNSQCQHNKHPKKKRAELKVQEELMLSF
uniref:Ig-like domain-containing protein n=1 Tax=Erpetoichthys calabaricus TaxID=27687 RepID=A0A8C4SUE5_ERPCA